MSEYNITNESTLVLVLRLRGGGGHGGLAFAGVCREWDGNMASVIVNAAMGVLFAEMRLVL